MANERKTLHGASPNVALLALAVLSSCGTVAPRTAAAGAADTLALPRQVEGDRGRFVLRQLPSGERVSVAQAVESLADADVVFLGELHDSSDGHGAQLALTRRIAEARGDLILSMEMLERDAQPRLDLYLASGIDEANFVAGTRLWPNSVAHYSPAVEFAKLHDFPVVAGNVYRPIAARVARRGRWSVAGDPWAARSVDASDGEYRRRFDSLLEGSSGHGGPLQFDRDNAFASQCIKDATMAESITRAIRTQGEGAAPVVHWCGAFHSDFGLGTVERLRRRLPHLNIAVVSMIEAANLTAPLEGDDLERGHYVVIVPPADDDRARP